MFKKLFLPVGLVLAIAVAWWLPAPGIWLKGHQAVPLLVVVIFLINGWSVRLAGSRLDRSFFLALFCASLLSLGIGPVVGTLLTRLLGLEGAVAAGLIVMASVPVTLSSATVVTEVSGGNRAWSLLMTIGMSLLGILTIPVMVQLCLGGGEVAVDAWGLLRKLALLVLLPFAAGHGGRRLVSWKTPAAVRQVPSACVILTVYAAFAASRSELSRIDALLLPRVLAGALGTHLILLALAVGGAVVQRLGVSECKAFCFVSSQKTLPVAISVLAALSCDSALALLPCLVFHFAQLIFDSALAAVWSRRPTA